MPLKKEFAKIDPIIDHTTAKCGLGFCNRLCDYFTLEGEYECCKFPWEPDSLLIMDVEDPDHNDLGICIPHYAAAVQERDDLANGMFELIKRLGAGELAFQIAQEIDAEADEILSEDEAKLERENEQLDSAGLIYPDVPAPSKVFPPPDEPPPITLAEALAKGVANAISAEGRTFGYKNTYTCEACNRRFVTKDIHEGVTPFMAKCVRDGCDGLAHSACYPQAIQDDEAFVPTHVWYRPAETDDIDSHNFEHISNGGLLMRKIEKHVLDIQNGKIGLSDKIGKSDG